MAARAQIFLATAIYVGGLMAISAGMAEGEGAGMFSTDQSGCYNGTYTAAIGVVSRPSSRRLLGCLESCLQAWWCVAARYTPSAGVCDIASVLPCTSGRAPLSERYYRVDASSMPSWSSFSFSFADVRSAYQTYKGCQDAFSKGVTTSGIVCIDPDDTGCFPVWCNFTAGQGWLTIHRRFSGQLDFISKRWLDYENGFGSISGEYWLGLRRVAALTKTSVKIEIDLVGHNNHAFTVTYNSFSISSAAQNYMLRVSGYVASGANLDYLSTYDGSPFSAPDVNPSSSVANCAVARGAGWWGTCGAIVANINGDYSTSSTSCVYWKGSADIQGCQLQYISLRILI